MPVPPNTTGVGAPSTQSLLAGLFRAYMELATDQVVVQNQKWKIPADARLYITVSSAGPQQAYGVTAETENATDPDKPGLVETVAVASREMIGIDIYSRSQAAVDRKEELLMALSSIAMQQLCEMYAIKVARIPASFADVSALEGAARLNRFHLLVAVLRTRTKTTPVAYYDQFSKPSLVIEP